jgi:sugar lactone lactonase YvrE
MEPAHQIVDFPATRPAEVPASGSAPAPRPSAPWRRVALPALVFLGLALLHVEQRRVGLVSLGAWLAAVGLTAYACVAGERRRMRVSLSRADALLLAVLVPFALDQLWRISADPGHYHIDEFITAYTSLSLPDAARLDWFAVYPEGWIAKFPVVFHVPQKVFFLLFGASLETVRVSIWPYYLAIAAYAFALGSLLVSRRTGIAAGTVCLFLAPNLSLGSMGLHFLSSIAFYIAALYHFLAALHARSRRQAALAGVFTALSYLTYAGSYVAGPVLALVALGAMAGAWRGRRGIALADGRSRRALLPVLAVSVALFTVTIAPFLVFAFRVDNFLLHRVRQVNAVSGDWVLATEQPRTPAERIRQQAWDTARSMVVPHIGGNIGYTFGGQALLDPLTAAVAAAGILFCLWRALRRRDLGAFALLVALGVPFVINGVLTQHPPPFHRMSVMFPVIAVLAALPLGLMADRLGSRWPALGTGALAVALAGLVWVNLRHVESMHQGMPQHGAAIARWLDRRLQPGDTVSVAASWSLHVAPELLFRTRGRYRLIADDPEPLLQRYEGGPMILFGPMAQSLEQLTQRFPEHELLTEIDGVPLGEMAVFMPRRGSAAVSPGTPTVAASGEGRNLFSGFCGRGPGELAAPRGIAVAPGGDIWVADTDNHRLQHFSPKGAYLGQLGHQGSGPDELNSPSGLAFDDAGNLYVADTWNHRIQKRRPKGTLATEWKSEIYAPFSLSVAGDELLVANTGMGRVLRIVPGGEVAATWGHAGTGAGELRDHTNVVGLGARVFVADVGNGRIQVYDRDGKVQAEWPVPEWQGGGWRWGQIAADRKRQRLYATIPAASAVLSFDLDGHRRERLDVTDGAGQALQDATGVAVTRDGRTLLVLDTRGCRAAQLALK